MKQRVIGIGGKLLTIWFFFGTKANFSGMLGSKKLAEWATILVWPAKQFGAGVKT